MPKPEIEILVCANERGPETSKPSCGPRGGMEVYRRFKDRVRELGIRDRVMVNRTGCLKHCSHGVTVAIWPFNIWYARVTPDDVDEILEVTVQGGGAEIARLGMPDIPWQ